MPTFEPLQPSPPPPPLGEEHSDASEAHYDSSDYNSETEIQAWCAAARATSQALAAQSPLELAASIAVPDSPRVEPPSRNLPLLELGPGLPPQAQMSQHMSELMGNIVTHVQEMTAQSLAVQDFSQGLAHETEQMQRRLADVAQLTEHTREVSNDLAFLWLRISALEAQRR